MKDKDEVVALILLLAVTFLVGFQAGGIAPDNNIELIELQMNEAQLQLELLHNGVCYGK